MIAIPDPRQNALLAGMIRSEHAPRRGRAAQIVDHLIAMQNREARRTSLYAAIGAGAAMPARWQKPEPRASFQYAGHMATTAARDKRLTPQSKALLVVLRARCGNGTRTETCKTTLAHIMGVCTRSIGRYIAELVRFGYIEACARQGKSGLYTGLVLRITEKVLPCFRKLAWLGGWLAQNLGEDGGNRDRTGLSYTNHSFKEESLIELPVRPSG
ncbi:MAG: helix-turn-helix domain-containing protein [Hyphomicrobiaceae bacterium]|nr:MAG: helix-turn-helix domain-containing protein [Hyphomicrobiaceae bacterium]